MFTPIAEATGVGFPPGQSWRRGWCTGTGPFKFTACVHALGQTRVCMLCPHHDHHDDNHNTTTHYHSRTQQHHNNHNTASTTTTTTRYFCVSPSVLSLHVVASAWRKRWCPSKAAGATTLTVLPACSSERRRGFGRDTAPDQPTGDNMARAGEEEYGQYYAPRRPNTPPPPGSRHRVL